MLQIGEGAVKNLYLGDMVISVLVLGILWCIIQKLNYPTVLEAKQLSRQTLIYLQQADGGHSWTQAIEPKVMLTPRHSCCNPLQKKTMRPARV